MSEESSGSYSLLIVSLIRIFVNLWRTVSLTTNGQGAHRPDPGGSSPLIIPDDHVVYVGYHSRRLRLLSPDQASAKNWS